MSALVKSKNVNIRTTEREYDAIKRFADFHGKSISSLVLDLLYENIEDWEDIRDAKEVINANEPFISWEEVKRKNGL